MKRLITISCILALILLSCYLGIDKIKETNSDMTALLEQIMSDVHNQKYSDAIQKAEIAQKRWENSESIINMYVNHDILDHISENITRLISYLKSRDISQIYVTIETIQLQLTHIYECELPLPKNIF